jgi:hypothetical protein
VSAATFGVMAADVDTRAGFHRRGADGPEFSSARTGVHTIYMSERDAGGRWGPAVPVTDLHGHAQDARPNVSHDGLEIVFDVLASVVSPRR